MKRNKPTTKSPPASPTTRKPSADKDPYRTRPPEPQEFTSDDDLLAWESDGWEQAE